MTAPSFDLFSMPPVKPLRPHQERALAMLHQSVGEAKKKRPVLKMPTGAGKTRTGAELVKGALAKGIYVVSDPELTQPADFDNAGPSFNPSPTISTCAPAFDRR